MNQGPYRHHIPPDDRPTLEPPPPRPRPQPAAYVPMVTEERAHWLALVVASRHPWLAQAGVHMSFEQVVITAKRREYPFSAEKTVQLYLSSSTTIGDVDRWAAGLWDELHVGDETVAR